MCCVFTSASKLVGQSGVWPRGKGRSPLHHSQKLRGERGFGASVWILLVAVHCIVLCSVSCGGGGNTQAVSNGTAGLSLTSLSFGNEPIDVTSSSGTITVNNTGSAGSSITSVTITGTNSGDFAEIANTCSSSVAAGGHCSIGVTFTPSAAGQRTATLSITDNASGSPVASRLTGTGIPDIILSWGHSPSASVEGYNVYRGTTPRGESSTPLNSTPLNGTTYVDENVMPGTTYYYVVRSVSSDGVPGAPSNEADAFVPIS